MRRHSTRFYNWSIEKASSDKAPLWLALLFVLEVFLVIPLDAVMVFFSLQNRRNIFLYTLLATGASLVSGVIGYVAGHFLWDLIGPWVVPNLISATLFGKVAFHIQMYENWAVFICALLPLPLKVMSLVSGVFHLNFMSYVTCIALARLARFGLIGILMAVWGEKVKLFMDRHFHRVLMVLGAKLVAGFALVWLIAR